MVYDRHIWPALPLEFPFEKSYYHPWVASIPGRTRERGLNWSEDACGPNYSLAFKESAITRRPVTTRLGSLSRLPAEILLMVLESLDFQALHRFSMVSLHAMNCVQLMPLCRTLNVHAPDIIARLACRSLGTDPTCGAVWLLIKNRHCDYCRGRYAAYMRLQRESLWRGKNKELRVCRSCLVRDNHRLLINQKDNSNWVSSDMYPTAKTSGRYHPSERIHYFRRS